MVAGYDFYRQQAAIGRAGECSCSIRGRSPPYALPAVNSLICKCVYKRKSQSKIRRVCNFAPHCRGPTYIIITTFHSVLALSVLCVNVRLGEKGQRENATGEGKAPLARYHQQIVSTSDLFRAQGGARKEGTRQATKDHLSRGLVPTALLCSPSHGTVSSDGAG